MAGHACAVPAPVALVKGLRLAALGLGRPQRSKGLVRFGHLRPDRACAASAGWWHSLDPAGEQIRKALFRWLWQLLAHLAKRNWRS